MTSIHKLALLLSLTAGCDQLMGGVPPIPTGATDPVDTIPVFREDGSLLEPRGDADGDGIPNQDEVDGYDITVDVNGFGVTLGIGILAEDLEVRHVTSDPRVADSDDDGLNDREERMVTADPRRQDSDGDTLLDLDEVRRWGTSPVSIDSDGDARGGDPDNPRPPQFALFDAAELRLVADPVAPGSGRLVPGFGATNPVDADTDGDGLNDYDELHSGLRRSTVAELPSFRLRPTPGATFSLGWNTVTTDMTMRSRTVTETFETDTAFEASTTTSTSSRIYQEIYAGMTTDATVSGGCCADIVSVQEEVGVYLGTETRFEQNLSFDMRASASEDLRHTNESVEAEERAMAIEIRSGVLRFAVDLENDGLVPFRASDLVFSVFYVADRAGGLVPLTELAASGDVVLSPGERQTVVLARNDIEVDAMRNLMRDPSRLLIRPSRYRLTNRDGADFDFQQADVRDRTARVAIDFGDRVIERDVAVVSFADGRASTVGQLLTELGVDFEATPLPSGSAVEFAIRIEDQGSELHTGPAPDLREALPYTERSGFGGPARMIKRGWFAVVLRRDATLARGEFFANPFEAPVRAGDVVTLIYSEDLDRDGLSLFEERQYGSSDSTAHSDGDGLSDYWEVREGWEVNFVGEPAYDASPNPTSNDSDGDGLSDLREARVGTDPLRTDTDVDGLTDVQELDDRYAGELDPLGGLDARREPSVACEATEEDDGGPSRCVVSLLPMRRSFPVSPRVVLNCDQLTPGCYYVDRFMSLQLDPDGPCYHFDHPSNGELYQVERSVLDAVRGRTASTGRLTIRYTPLFEATVFIDSDLEVAQGNSPYCTTLTQFGSHEWGSGRRGFQYAVLPCARWTDPDDNGTCDTPVGSAALASVPTNYVCTELSYATRPFVRLRITATDPHGDLTFLRLDEAGTERFMEYRFAETGLYARDEIVRPCTVLPETVTVTAADRYGTRATTTCAFPAGFTCIE